MVGIFLALQVNNWNEWRKDRVTEREILFDLQENLELNVSKLNEEIDRKYKSDFSSQVILNAMDNKLPYQDTMVKHFGWALSFEDPGPLSRAGYESFKNIGTDILRNKTLKKKSFICSKTHIYFQVHASKDLWNLMWRLSSSGNNI